MRLERQEDKDTYLKGFLCYNTPLEFILKKIGTIEWECVGHIAF